MDVMRILAAWMALVALAACGADGEPVMPTMNGIIGIGSGGVYTSANVGLRKGPISLAIGRGCSLRGC